MIFMNGSEDLWHLTTADSSNTFIYSSECNLTSISLQFYEIPLLVFRPQKEVACWLHDINFTEEFGASHNAFLFAFGRCPAQGRT